MNLLHSKEPVQWLLHWHMYLKIWHIAIMICGLVLPPVLQVLNIMVPILDTWSEGGLEELGVNCAFSLGSNLDLKDKVDAEHTINGHDHLDCATLGIRCSRRTPYCMQWELFYGVVLFLGGMVQVMISERASKLPYARNSLTLFFYVAYAWNAPTQCFYLWN